MLSREDLLTILACLECKEFATEGRLDPRVPIDQYNNVMTVVEMLDHIESIKKIIKNQLEM